VKVGDLVTLSAYGKKVKRTGWVKEDDIGIIIKHDTKCGWADYKIMWNQSIWTTWGYSSKRGYNTRGSFYEWQTSFDRRDLKHVN
jgi:hypothetical protein